MDEPSETTTESVIQELKRLTERYDQSIELAEPDGHEPIPTITRNGLHLSLWEIQIRRQGLSADEIKTRKELLLELKTSYLPSLEHQLLDLLNSILGLPDPTPTHLDLQKTLEIISQLGHTIDQINRFIHSIHIPAAAYNPSTPTYMSSNDHEYGDVKSYRAWELICKLDELFRTHISSLFQHHISFLRIQPQRRSKTITRAARETLIDATDESSAMIRLLIDWSNRSDFSLLQVDWRRLGSNLDFTLQNFPPKFLAIDLPSKPPTTQSIQDDQPEQDLQSNLDQHDSASRTDQEPSTNEDIQRSHTSPPANDHHHHQESSTRLPTQDEIPPRQIQLVKAVIPLLKLTRILLNKLSNTRTNKLPFTIGTKMSSVELRRIEDQLGSLCHTIQRLVNLSLPFYYHDRELLMAQMTRIKSLPDELSTEFDSSILLLCFYLLPRSDAQIDLPLSGNHFKTWFLTLREHFCLAIGHFRAALYHFKDEIRTI
ncbi:hypothetical protein PGT21_027518 [Puccinia graminis f. sp. tritici]|uniref:Uncharacterized protein n=2 Tax=Puccinia graminis f. sp. tritici TaxID=56615 RepID=A0A5B0LRR9_PUCGR|nr:hypothetical protein PGT21_027518 [Puccinia graminis f. sp. tritici]